MNKKPSELLLGTSYYPEHDPENEWDADARLMRDLGVNTARIGEFCWTRMQQPDGSFTLDWIERCIETLYRHGIKTVLCTPSACPPAWLVERYPDLFCVTANGRRGLFGGRRHYSVFHEGYREASRILATELARRFGKHPAVAGWQLDNEVGSYYTVDCSEPALKAFRVWVENRYGNVEELNRRWGLIFWNQEIQRFDQIPAPTEMMTTRNPSFLLDYNRFSLEGMSDFMLAQAEAIRQFASPGQFVVASAVEPVLRVLNRAQKEKGVKWVDETTIHNYPELFPEPGQAAMHLDRFRSMDPSSRFLVMEQQIGSGRTTTGGLNPAIRRYWAFQALAHGAKGICWFHWRRFRTGCEWRLSSIIERDRRPRSTFRGLQGIIGEMRKIEPFLEDGRVCPDVQILLSLDNVLAFDRASEATFWMAIQLPDGEVHRFPLWERMARRLVYNPLSRFGLTLGFVEESDNWDAALPLIIPDLDICPPVLVEKLEAFCKRGGTVICFPGAGERDVNGAHGEKPPPGILAPFFGVELLDYMPLELESGSIFDHVKGSETESADTTFDRPVEMARIGSVSLLLDTRHGEVLDVKDADVLGIYAKGPFAGKAVITSRQIGAGRAIYLGATPADETAAETMYASILPACARQRTAYQRVQWISARGQFAFLINHSAAICPLPSLVHDLITDERLSALPPWAIALVKE